MSTPEFEVHRAIVHYSNPTTGEAHVRIPSLLGAGQTVTIPTTGLTSSDGFWNVPSIGSSTFIAVSADRTQFLWLTAIGVAGSGGDDPSNEPIGHEDRTASYIAFDNGTRTFSIQPANGSYVVWCVGLRYEKATLESIQIPDVTGLYYISFDAQGQLQYSTDYFVWDQDCPTAYVYWNSTTQRAEFLADERHGITMDWQTHEYLHRTRGAAYANGFDASNFDTSTQDGNTDAQAKLDIDNGTFFDEDLQVDVRHSLAPAQNTWEQQLQGPARIPVFYKIGTGWKYDAPTDFPVKQGTTHPVYNRTSDWSVQELGANSYGVQWIVATNQLNYPILSIMGQTQYANVGQAESASWADMDLDGLPIVEIRVLYKIIFRATGSNTPGCYFEQIDDYRNALSNATSTAAAVVDHGNLTGLADDDHPQYALADGSRGSGFDHGSMIGLADNDHPQYAVAGSDGQIQYNNNGSFGAIPTLTYSNTTGLLQVEGDVRFDGDTLFVDASADSVGIGTTSPDFQFQVESGNTYVSVNPASNDAIRLVANNATGRPYISFHNQDNNGSLVRKGYIGYATPAQTQADSIFYFNAGDGTSDLYISAAAVGINDATPSYTLDVNGTGRFTGTLRTDSDFITSGVLYYGNSAIVASDGGTSNIDHIWHDDGTNTWNFCSDTSYRATGNSTVRAGGLTASGAGSFGGVLTLTGQGNDGNDRSGYTSYNNNFALVMKPAANDGATGILFPSIGNNPSDFAYIVYDEDYPEAGVTAGERGALVLGSENDGGGSSDHVRVKARLVVEADQSSSDNTYAFQVKSSNTTSDLLRVRRSDGETIVSGYLQGNAVVGSTYIGANGTDIYGTAGRNYFKDSEKSSGAGLRVGAAWSKYGIYSEDGDVVVGAATGIVRFGDNNSNTYVSSDNIYSTDAFISGVVEANEFRATDYGPDNDAAFTFVSDEDSGMYRAGTNDVRLTTGGTWRIRAYSDGCQVNGNYRGSRAFYTYNSQGNVGDATINIGDGNGSGVILAFNPSGYAPLITCGQGEHLYVRNYLNNAYAILDAVLIDRSSVHSKQSIQTLGDTPLSAGSMGNDLAAFDAMETVRKLRPVSYYWYEVDALPRMPVNEDGTRNERRISALQRLNNIRAKKNLPNFDREDIRHICGRDCDRSMEDPCWRTKNFQNGKVGFIAQEVGEVIPQAAVLSEEREEFESIDTLALVAVLTKAVQDMDARIKELEALTDA